MRSSYLGRLAPTPSGLLHLGHVHTFAVAAARARAARGALLLRMDDLDPQRSQPQFVEAAIDDLDWLGLYPRKLEDADIHASANAVTHQSRRHALYLRAWAVLVARGHVYPCHCTRRQLQAFAPPAKHADQNPEQHWEQDPEPLYPGTCRPAHPPTQAQRQQWLAAGPAGYSWRFRIAELTPITFTDRALGPRSFLPGRDLGDFPIWRRDNIAAYQLATVVDDASPDSPAYAITEVVRGADLLLSTARQLLLFAALGHPAPAFYHCPLVLDSNGQRLAKRADSLSVQSLRRQGLKAVEVLALANSAPTGS